MAKLLRAYERNILFGMLPNKIIFTVPIHWRNGDEYNINCILLEAQPTLMQYEVLRLPSRDDTPRLLECCDPAHAQYGVLR